MRFERAVLGSYNRWSENGHWSQMSTAAGNPTLRTRYISQLSICETRTYSRRVVQHVTKCMHWPMACALRWEPVGCLGANQHGTRVKQGCSRRLYSHVHHVHFVGIGGSGMLPLAVLAARQSMQVTGWDDSQTGKCATLQSIGINTRLSLEESVTPDTVVASAAIARDHPQLQMARQKGVLVVSRQAWFAKELKSYHQTAVAGSHGKTTTTALTAFLLHQLGHPVPFVCGGEIPQLPWACPARPHAVHTRPLTAEALVIEADEFRQAFLGLSPKIAVLTNVDHEHVDCYPTMHDVERAFNRFLWQIQPGGILIACQDDAGSHRAAQTMTTAGQLHSWRHFQSSTTEEREKRAWVIMYGSGADCDVRVSHGQYGAGSCLCTCNLTWRGLHGGVGDTELHCCFQSRLVGHHNMLNATAALVASSVCAVMQSMQFDTPSQALSTGASLVASTVADCCKRMHCFEGTVRRMQLLYSCYTSQILDRSRALHGRTAGIDRDHVYVYDDYAHHPAEIAATLAALREKHVAAAVVAVWQPISRARLQTFMEEFCTNFKSVYRLIIAPMDTSREAANPGRDECLVRRVHAKLQPGGSQLATQACIADTTSIVTEAHSALMDAVQKSPGMDIVVLFLGSGNITDMAHEFSECLERQELGRLRVQNSDGLRSSV
eukprot:jgi/Ulvmu1/4474/UM002_0199.1